MSGRVALLFLGLTLAILISVSGVAGAAGRTVTLRNIAFSPEFLSIAKGSTVTFAFRDEATLHDVTSTGSKRFTTIRARTSGSVRRVFNRTGVYRYVCTLHPGMSGRITVR